MTVQLKDTMFIHPNEVDFIEGEVLKTKDDRSIFYPSKYGFKRSTELYESACSKGYIATYEIKFNKLVLKDLEINAETNIELNGIRGVKNLTKNEFLYSLHVDGESMDKEAEEEMYNQCKYLSYSYTNVNLPLDFTGTIIIGLDRGHNGLVFSTMDWPGYWIKEYKSLKELEFKNGELIAFNESDIIELKEEYEKMEEDFKKYIK